MDELNLSPNIRTAHPPRLPIPNHVHRLVTLNRSARRLELPEPLLGVHAAFNRAVVLSQDAVQVRFRSVPATAARCPFLLYVRDGGAVDWRLIRVSITRDCGWQGSLSALRKSRLAASASRNAESRKSIVAPAELMARFR